MILLFIIPLLFILFVGLTILAAANELRDNPLLKNIALSYGVGTGALAMQMMLYSFFAIPWTSYLIVLPWICLLIFSCFKHDKIPIRFTKYTIASRPIEKLLILGILLTIAFVLFESLLRPLSAFDAWANWFLSGKAYYLSGHIDPQYVKYANNSNAPILNLLIAFIYQTIGQANEQIAMLFFTFFYVSQIIIFYFTAKKYMSTKKALLFTFLLATTEDLIRHGGRYDVGYGDLPLGYFIFCAVAYLLEMAKTKSIKKLILFSLFITSAALIKSEGIPIYIITQSVGFFLMRKNKKSFFVFGGSALVLLSWYIFTSIYHLPENPFIQSGIKLYRIPSVLYYMIKEFFNIGRWNLLWIGFLASLPFIKNNYISKILSIILLLQLFAYFLVYLMTPVPVAQHIPNSFDRLLLQVAPLAMLLISTVAIINKNKVDKINHK